MRSMDFFTVVYKSELCLLKLQAISFEKFVNPEIINNIYVIVNDHEPDFSFSWIYKNVIRCYGDLAPKVRILETRFVDQYALKHDGYIAQQIVKLMAHTLSISPYYCVLDAKNFFIKPISIDNFFDGRPRINFEEYKSDYQVYLINGYYNYNGVQQNDRTYNLPAMMTPFVFSVENVKSMINAMEARSGKYFAQAFASAIDGHAEFLAYSTYLWRNKALGIYSRSGRMSLTLWEGYWLGPDALTAALNTALSGEEFMVGLHTKRIRQMDVAEHEVFGRFLNKIGLFQLSEGFRLEVIK